MTQNELRDLYRKRLESEKQTFIADQIGVANYTLTRFKRGQNRLHADAAQKLELYLTGKWQQVEKNGSDVQ